ncbi:hypothetical protein ACWGE0_24115 [Lentzea sp. NPDC054927]
METPLIGTTGSTGIFISQLLDALVTAFDSRGRSVCLDRREVAPGEVFGRAICLALVLLPPE